MSLSYYYSSILVNWLTSLEIRNITCVDLLLLANLGKWQVSMDWLWTVNSCRNLQSFISCVILSTWVVRVYTPRMFPSSKMVHIYVSTTYTHSVLHINCIWSWFVRLFVSCAVSCGGQNVGFVLFCFVLLVSNFCFFVIFFVHIQILFKLLPPIKIA